MAVDPGVVTAIVAAATTAGGGPMTAMVKRNSAKVDLTDRTVASAQKQLDQLEGDVSEPREHLGVWTACVPASQTTMGGMAGMIVRLGGTPPEVPQLPSLARKST